VLASRFGFGSAASNVYPYIAEVKNFPEYSERPAHIGGATLPLCALDQPTGSTRAHHTLHPGPLRALDAEQTLVDVSPSE
jgi:hypothetical protein